MEARPPTGSLGIAWGLSEDEQLVSFSTG